MDAQKHPKIAMLAAMAGRQLARRLGAPAARLSTAAAPRGGGRDARGAFARSVAKDIAALERIRDAYAAGAEMDAAFVKCASRLLDGVRQHCRVYATGMGKSGVVARRLASSLASVSVSSQFVHGGEWVHGELGGLNSGDVVIIFSHSGKTDELLPLPAHFRHAGCCVVSVVGDLDSPLAAAADFALSVQADDDPAFPVPSRSIIAQEAFCNALVEFLTENLDGAADSLRQSHPGGEIGRSYREADD